VSAAFAVTESRASRLVDSALRGLARPRPVLTLSKPREILRIDTGRGLPASCFCLGPGYHYQEKKSRADVLACSALHAGMVLGG
jgi:hypothetical protein